MPTTVNSPRLLRVFTQIQTAYTSFNNAGGTWSNTGAQMIRVDQGGFQATRNAPYSRFPVVTGSRSEVAGVRGRKSCSVELSGLPLIPSGTGGVVPDTDHILQSAFGAAATAGVYSLADTTYPILSLFAFYHGVSMTNRAIWGGTVSRIRFNFNGPFMTMDVSIQAGYMIDSTGFAAEDTQAKAGLSAFPTAPTNPTVTGTPIAGFGNGYTITLHSQTVELKTRVLSVTFETGNQLVADVYGSAYPVQIVGGARRVTMQLDTIDDDSAALSALKTDCDTDNTTISGSIVAGSGAGKVFTFALGAIQPNAFSIRDEDPYVMVSIPESAAHASAVGSSNDFSLTVS